MSSRTAAPRSKKPGVRNLNDFPLDNTQSMPQRVAAFLDWWASQHPYDFVGYHEITKAVNGYRHLPRLQTQEVEAMRRTVGRSGTILHDKFRRSIVCKRGLGARATVDSADTIRHTAIARTKKVERDIAALAKVDEIIDLNSIPNTPENKPLKQWYQRDVRGMLKQITAPEFLARMLPPKSDDKDGGE